MMKHTFLCTFSYFQDVSRVLFLFVQIQFQTSIPGLLLEVSACGGSWLCCWAWIWCCGVFWLCAGCMASNLASGGLCGPTAIGWAQAIVGAGIINVDIANIVFPLRSTEEYWLKITKRKESTHSHNSLFLFQECSSRFVAVAFAACLGVLWIGLPQFSRVLTEKIGRNTRPQEFNKTPESETWSKSRSRKT